MTYLKDILAENRSAYQDPRARMYLVPDRILQKKGNVTDDELLLTDHPFQPFIGKAPSCVMSNEGDGEKAMLLLDFGRELHGLVRLSVNEISPEGTRACVRLCFGESAMEALSQIGQKNATNDHAVRDHVYDIGMLSTLETNESGFRFVCVQLETADCAVQLHSLQACLIYRDVPYLGTFECSDPLLNTIWNTAAYTVHLNMQDYLWDGIKRDRLAWQGDMHTEVMTISHVFGDNPVVPETLDFLRDRTPDDEFVNGYSSYSLWWIILQAEWYSYTGNLAYLTEQKDFLEAQVMLAIKHIDENGRETLPEFRFLDWKNRDNEEATHAGLQSLMVLAFSKAAELLQLLGNEPLSNLCNDTVRKMKTHVPNCGNSKQAAALLVLSGLGDACRLNRTVLSPGGASGWSTFMGYYLLAAKAQAGDTNGALRDLRSYWGGMLQMGATTFWEDFGLDWMENAARIDEIVPDGKKDIHGDYGAFCYKGYRHSLCHGWSSGPVPFLARHVLGIRIASPGCRKLLIEPHLGNLAWAKGTFPTPYGVVSVSHETGADGLVHTTYDAPEGVEILLHQED